MPLSRSITAVKTLLLAGTLATAPELYAQITNAAQMSAAGQNVPVSGGVIAIVPLDQNTPGAAAEVTGALQVYNGRAFITTNGTITSGNQSTHVTLPYRGTLLVCASTTVKLATDTSVPAGDVPGLLMAMDSGAVEMSFATSNSADILLTPDFRILIGGPGATEVKVRLGSGGDTCVDNPGADAPYVVVNSLFDSGLYRVQPGQRVMFQHGDLHEVVDQEKEPCGCPPDPDRTTGNEFPLAQSEGLAPTPAPTPTPKQPLGGEAQAVPPLVYSSPAAAIQAAQIPPAPELQPTVSAETTPPPAPAQQKKQPGIFTRLGRFFKRVFGAE